MTNANQNGARRQGLKLARVKTMSLLVLPLGLLLAGPAQHAARAQTQATGSTCAAALDALTARWQAAGFAEPSKPAQMIVSGRHGVTITAGQYNNMTQRIRSSARDCAAGHDEEAMRNINSVREALLHTGAAAPQFGD